MLLEINSSQTPYSHTIKTMLRLKTIFVVGAGASNEVGLPVGGGLRDIISRKLDFRFDDFGRKNIGSGDQKIWDELARYHGRDMNSFQRACWRIRDGVLLSSSIDDYIDVHRHDRGVEICGKLAITASILEAERSSKLYFRRENIADTINFQAIQSTWYPNFYSLLTQGVAKENLSGLFDNFSVISFNYDRCIEHFLVHAIASHYDVPIEQAQELTQKKLRIFRPYGSVGPYFGPQHQCTVFGSSMLPNLPKVQIDLRTYTEQINDHVHLEDMRKALLDAEVIVFLGCAFHENNMTLLQNKLDRSYPKKIYATRKGISPEELPLVKKSIAKLFCKNPEEYGVITDEIKFDSECRDIFNTYRLWLRSSN
jgi:hypothetical protein